MDRIVLVKGDITKLEADALVNAANSGMLGGGGVDGAIHRAGGPAILEACQAWIRQYGSCPTGQAIITTGGKLKAKYVIHAVGPLWNPGQEEVNGLLMNAYQSALDLAVQHHVKVLAFPNISTGIYGFPKDEAAKLAIKTVLSFLSNSAYPEKVVFCCYDDENFKIYKKLLEVN